MSRTEEILTELYENTLMGNAAPVIELTSEGLQLGMTPGEILWEGLIPALDEVGRRFETGDFFVPEMLIAARAMQGAMDILKPIMISAGVEVIGTCLMLTVRGDMHDIGKNLCNIMLEGAGFKVIDMGVNVPARDFVSAVQEHQPDVVGFSALLTTTMPMFKMNMEALEKAGLRGKAKVMVGGAPVTAGYAEKCGADGFAKDAVETVRIAKEFMGIETEAAAPSA